jgi:3-isopropylmalate/(R)-2-methylmalate dehydratase small subunit
VTATPSRQPFHVHRGLVAPLRRNHVDTDQIIPKQFLKRLERSGFGPFLFHDWRHTSDGSRDAAFVLNQPAFAGASVLAAGVNFGCGSSREHAAWALLDAGFKVVIAPSFADIFRANAIGNGMLPVALSETAVNTILDRAEAGTGYTVDVDLDRSEVRDSHGLREAFTIDTASRQRLLDGTDEIDLILKHETAIASFERQRQDVNL